MISAIVPIPTTSIEINEMMLMKFFFFFERKYLLAMKNGKFTPLRVLPEPGVY